MSLLRMQQLFTIVSSIFFILTTILVTLVAFPTASFAQRVIQANPINQRATIFLSPTTGTFLEGTLFEIPIFLNTHSNSINALEVEVKFDPKKLSVVKASGGQSVVGIWVEPPSYSNKQGTVRIVGAIPNSLTTESGLITTITFKAIAPGPAQVYISKTTKILANDGFGSEVPTAYGRATYTIMRKPPEDVKVFSDTHPYTDQWYNNNSPVLSWEKDPAVTDFSFTFDNKPNTIPDNTSDTKDTTISFPDADEGVYYFHIKARRANVWGGTTHFPVRIDITPPAKFNPTIETLMNKTEEQNGRALVSFMTTDNLSGIDHYEIGVIEQTSSTDVSPSFVQTESPFVLPLTTTDGSRVIVRAFDRAGNVQDVAFTVSTPILLVGFVKSNLVWILVVLLATILLIMIFHYLIGHRVLSHFRRALKIIHDEEHPAYQPIIAKPPVEPQYNPSSDSPLNR